MVWEGKERRMERVREKLKQRTRRVDDSSGIASENWDGWLCAFT
jgi:hypothetical protein